MMMMMKKDVNILQTKFVRMFKANLLHFGILVVVAVYFNFELVTNAIAIDFVWEFNYNFHASLGKVMLEKKIFSGKNEHRY